MKTRVRDILLTMIIMAAAVFALWLAVGMSTKANAQTQGFFSVQRQTMDASNETFLYRLIDRELGTVCYYRHTSRLAPTTLGCVKYQETTHVQPQRP